MIKITTKEYLGEVGVDSGSLIIIDPGYLTDAKRWEPSKFLEGAKKYEAEGNDRMAENMLRLAREKGELKKMLFDWTAYCKDSDEADYKGREYAGGVVSRTRDGDGGFPVYAIKNNKGEILRIQVEF